MNAQRIRLVTTQAVRSRPMTVRTVSSGEAKRFLCSHPINPRSLFGGACAITISDRTKARSCSCMALPFHQRNARVEPVHEDGSGQADTQIDDHPDENDLHRLPRLV